MATQKKAWLSAIATLVLVAVIGLTFAFKSDTIEKTSKRLTTTWYYNSNSTASSDITDGTKWTKVDPQHSGCVEATEDLPCQLEVDNVVTNQAQLDSYFTSFYLNNPTTITNSATTRRAIPD